MYLLPLQRANTILTIDISVRIIHVLVSAAIAVAFIILLLASTAFAGSRLTIPFAAPRCRHFAIVKNALLLYTPPNLY